MKTILQLKEAMSCFGTGVTVITTHFEGQDWGMTCNSFNTVSLEPAMVLWSIRESSLSRPAFEQASGYTVNVLALAQQALALRFTTGSQAERFAGVELQRLGDNRPLIEGSMAWFDCALERTFQAGDHYVMLGRVLDFGVTQLEGVAAEPLLYARRKFGGLQTWQP